MLLKIILLTFNIIIYIWIELSYCVQADLMSQHNYLNGRIKKGWL